MSAHPLTIEADPSDIRVLASSLELRNKKTLDDAFNHNLRLKEQKERDSQKHLHDVAHEAANDFIR